MTLVLDTGPILAAVDRRDRHHVACAELLRAHAGRLVVPAPVLVEVDYWLNQRVSGAAATAFLRAIVRGDFAVAELDEPDYARTLEICEAYGRSGVGFVDASVLAVMERIGERRLATLDHRHFRMLRPRHVPALELLPAVVP